VISEVLEVFDRKCRETQTPRPAWLVDLREAVEE